MPAEGRSATCRWYRLWIRRDLGPHNGHLAIPASDRTAKIIESDESLTFSITNPLGISDEIRIPARMAQTILPRARKIRIQSADRRRDRGAHHSQATLSRAAGFSRLPSTSSASPLSEFTDDTKSDAQLSARDRADAAKFAKALVVAAKAIDTPPGVHHPKIIVRADERAKLEMLHDCREFVSGAASAQNGLPLAPASRPPGFM